MEKILLDTDIGNDTDDLNALTYLLCQPECDLRGIMAVSADAAARAALAGEVCRSLGRKVPIFVGTDLSLMQVPSQEGPLDNHKTLFDAMVERVQYPGLAEGLRHFRDEIVQNPHEVTLIAIGPLTDVALLFSIWPETVSLLKELRVMGGSFFPNPACTWDITSEYNIRCDAVAAKIVLQAPVKTLTVFGVDLTWNFQRTREQVCGMLADIPKLCEVHDVFAALPEKWTCWFHDPLTCGSLFMPGVGEFVQGRITVDLSQDGWAKTVLTPDPAGNCRVCRDFPQEAYFAHHTKIVRSNA